LHSRGQQRILEREAILQMTKPSDDEGLHLVPDDKPRPRLFQEITETEPPAIAAPPIERPNFFSGRRVANAVGIVLALIILGGGVAYWIERHRYPVVVTIALPDSRESPDSASDTFPPLVPIRPDMLQVTSIVLGKPRLAIVNGEPLGEGEWFRVKTPLGSANVRVILIQDGLVRFKHGGQIIDVRLQTAQGAQH
jgi:hypothetical protein